MDGPCHTKSLTCMGWDRIGWDARGNPLSHLGSEREGKDGCNGNTIRFDATIPPLGRSPPR